MTMYNALHLRDGKYYMSEEKKGEDNSSALRVA